MARLPYLFAELLDRGWSRDDLAKLAGGNVLRAMRANEAKARELQAARPASDALIEELDAALQAAQPAADAPMSAAASGAAAADAGGGGGASWCRDPRPA